MLKDAPTKSNLLRLRQELDFARLGLDLLSQKRDILIVELLTLVEQAVDIQDKVEQGLAAAFEALQESVLNMGKLRVTHVSNAVNVAAHIQLSQRRVIGVALPVVETEFEDHQPYFGPLGTNFRNDSSVEAFSRALELIGHLAELKLSIMRIAAEVRRTVRKVNALEKTSIPGLEKTVAHIENRLEENDRDAYVLMKTVKDRLMNTMGNG